MTKQKARRSQFDCPICGNTSYRQRAISSRQSEFEGLQVVRRRRECESCASRFTTYEIMGRDAHKLATAYRWVSDITERWEAVGTLEEVS